MNGAVLSRPLRDGVSQTRWLVNSKHPFSQLWGWKSKVLGQAESMSGEGSFPDHRHRLL